MENQQTRQQHDLVDVDQLEYICQLLVITVLEEEMERKKEDAAKAYLEANEFKKPFDP